MPSPPAGNPANVRTFYSPEDHVPQVLQSVVSSVAKSVVVAMFGFDDDVLAAMLDTALKKPAIYVQITLDASQATGVHEKDLLANYANDMTGNSVAIGHSERGAIMHRTMVIVDGLWRIPGSTNWSTSGQRHGQSDPDLPRRSHQFSCAACPVPRRQRQQPSRRLAATRPGETPGGHIRQPRLALARYPCTT